MTQSKKERTQKSIIQAAKQIIHNKGYESLTVRHLAEVTGFSYTNIYYYFKDLNALLWNLRLDMIEDMIRELSMAPSHKEDPVDEIIDALCHYTNYYFQRPNVFRFFYFYPFTQPSGDDRYQKLEEKFNGIWKTSFLRLIQEHVIEPNEIEVVSKTIIYALQGMIMLSFSSNGSTKCDDIEKELIKTVKHLFKKQ